MLIQWFRIPLAQSGGFSLRQILQKIFKIEAGKSWLLALSVGQGPKQLNPTAPTGQLTSL